MKARERSQRANDLLAARVIRQSEARRVTFSNAEREAREAWGEDIVPGDRRRHLTLIPGGLPADAVVDRREHAETALRNAGRLA